jgi:hypothetical protein
MLIKYLIIKYKGFDEFLDQVTCLPPSEWDPNIRLKPPDKIPLKEERIERHHKQNSSNLKEDNESNNHENDDENNNSGLVFTRKFCGGLINDFKRKAPHYLSDFTDGFNLQCLSSILFMYFACLSPIITFGGLLEKATNKNMVNLKKKYKIKKV